MNLVELDRSLRKLRLSGMAETLETRLLQANAEKIAPLDFLSALVGDELVRRQDRLIEIEQRFFCSFARARAGGGHTWSMRM